MQSKSESATSSAKKIYSCPVMVEYGDIRAMTHSNLNGGKADGMSGTGMQKTV